MLTFVNRFYWEENMLATLARKNIVQPPIDYLAGGSPCLAGIMEGYLAVVTPFALGVCAGYFRGAKSDYVTLIDLPVLMLTRAAGKSLPSKVVGTRRVPTSAHGVCGLRLPAARLTTYLRTVKLSQRLGHIFRQHAVALGIGMQPIIAQTKPRGQPSHTIPDPLVIQLGHQLLLRVSGKRGTG